MSFASKYNHDKPKFDVPRRECEWITLAELHKRRPDVDHPLRAVLINRKSKYGNNPVLVTGGYAVHAPRHLLKTVEAILNDADDVAAINAGKVGFRVREYTTRDGLGTGLSVDWVDL